MTIITYEEQQRLSQLLLSNLKERRAAIVELTDRFVRGEFDAQYRYYHQSFKVYARQHEINLAVALFKQVAPCPARVRSPYSTPHFAFSRLCASLSPESSFQVTGCDDC
jgi:hypothetical protein